MRSDRTIPLRLIPCGAQAPYAVERQLMVVRLRQSPAVFAEFVGSFRCILDCAL